MGLTIDGKFHKQSDRLLNAGDPHTLRMLMM
jgi:hypothetical protein